MEVDPLQRLDPNRWTDLQQAFKRDCPRGIPGYYILKTQRKWINLGLEYGFTVFCPNGNVENGIVAVNDKMGFYEIVIQCPEDDTTVLEEALAKTKVIDWKRSIIVPFAPQHVVDCVKRVSECVHVEMEGFLPSESFVLYKERRPFDSIRLPKDITFGRLRTEHAELVDSHWPHRYATSLWYFLQIIKADSGYALFHGQDVICWVFVNDAGTLGHLYTLQQYRRKGYAEMLIKLVCNVMLNENNDIFAFCVYNNKKSSDLFRKIGFENFDSVGWCFFKSMD